MAVYACMQYGAELDPPCVLKAHDYLLEVISTGCGQGDLVSGV